MNGINKRSLAITFLLIAMLSSVLVIQSVNAQSIPKPSVPEFTLRLVDNSYDVPSSTTTTTDPYTGKQTVTTYPGYHVENKSIDVIIKNQEFTSYSNDNQNTIYLFYNVSYRGHFASDWKYYPWNGSYGRNSNAVTRIPQSTSEYTVVPFSVPTEGQMDFRVQAQMGYYIGHQEFVPVPGAPFSVYTFIGASSGFSNIHTIDLVNGTVTITPNTTKFPSYTQPASTTIPDSTNPTSPPVPTPTQIYAPTQIPTSSPDVPAIDFESIILPLNTFIIIITVLTLIIIVLSVLIFSLRHKTTAR